MQKTIWPHICIKSFLSEDLSIGWHFAQIHTNTWHYTFKSCTWSAFRCGYEYVTLAKAITCL
jgi:hypothetical protein